MEKMLNQNDGSEASVGALMPENNIEQRIEEQKDHLENISPSLVEEAEKLAEFSPASDVDQEQPVAPVDAANGDNGIAEQHEKSQALLETLRRKEAELLEREQFMKFLSEPSLKRPKHNAIEGAETGYKTICERNDKKELGKTNSNSLNDYKHGETLQFEQPEANSKKKKRSVEMEKAMKSGVKDRKEKSMSSKDVPKRDENSKHKSEQKTFKLKTPKEVKKSSRPKTSKNPKGAGRPSGVKDHPLLAIKKSDEKIAKLSAKAWKDHCETVKKENARNSKALSSKAERDKAAKLRGLAKLHKKMEEQARKTAKEQALREQAKEAKKRAIQRQKEAREKARKEEELAKNSLQESDVEEAESSGDENSTANSSIASDLDDDIDEEQLQTFSSEDDEDSVDGNLEEDDEANSSSEDSNGII